MARTKRSIILSICDTTDDLKDGLDIVFDNHHWDLIESNHLNSDEHKVIEKQFEIAAKAIEKVATIVKKKKEQLLKYDSEYRDRVEGINSLLSKAGLI